MIPNDVQQYLNDVDDKRRVGFINLFDTIQTSIPNGFKLCISNYNMIGWVVPLERYPDGYHVQPNTPLPFINLAVQKDTLDCITWVYTVMQPCWNGFKIVHSSMYVKVKHGEKLCSIYKCKENSLALIGELASKMTVQDWIGLYESVQK